MSQEIVVGSVLAGVGLLITALSGSAALGVRRLLGHTDELKTTVNQHAITLAEMNLKMPNGEWREMKDGVAACQGGIRVVGERLDTLTDEFREHAQTEKDRMCEAIAETYPRLRPLTINEPKPPKTSKRRKKR